VLATPPHLIAEIQALDEPDGSLLRVGSTHDPHLFQLGSVRRDLAILALVLPKYPMTAKQNDQKTANRKIPFLTVRMMEGVVHEQEGQVYVLLIDDRMYGLCFSHTTGDGRLKYQRI
jgi:hypothetical protein